ncbi:arylamine N-acetyltransferase [Streptomyces sp. NPDC058623]|uniref:arylamine N-acetyltransferase family protein n=1 Tax=Streptomyces sp. NPDC058623 TaxID=3346563 RepID=UPI00365F0EBC
MLTDDQVARYLERIGAARPARADHAALRDLQSRHVLSVPFENIDFHLPVRVGITLEGAYDKVVPRRRGGGCWELNSLFARLLTALGFQVHAVAGQPFDAGRMGPLMGHVSLRVKTVESEETWLTDVGNGRGGARFPLRWDLAEPQSDPHGVYRLVPGPYGDRDLYKDGTAQFRFEERPREFTDMVATVHWSQNAEESPFRRELMCFLPTEAGLITTDGRSLYRHESGSWSREPLGGTDSDVLTAYREHFGIELTEPPVLPDPGKHA